MVILWALIALIVLIAVIAALNWRPRRLSLPNQDQISGFAGTNEFTDVSGPATIEFVEISRGAYRGDRSAANSSHDQDVFVGSGAGGEVDLGASDTHAGIANDRFDIADGSRDGGDGGEEE